MVILGIDYGEKWLGLALSVDGVIETIKSQKSKVKSQNYNLKLKVIKQVCVENQVDKIVIGLPRGRLKQEIIDFAEKLKKDLKLPVDLWDESLSSQEAVATMVASNVAKMKRRNKEHSVAAAIILRDYWESQK